MTNVEVVLEVGLVLGASAWTGFYLLRKHITWHAQVLMNALLVARREKETVDAEVKAGIKQEMRNLQLKVETEASELHSKIDSVLDYVGTHAETLKTHAEDLRNHAKNITDVASAAKFAITRQTPTR